MMSPVAQTSTSGRGLAQPAPALQSGAQFHQSASVTTDFANCGIVQGSQFLVIWMSSRWGKGGTDIVPLVPSY